ncbi:MAG: hypothetical protein CVU13_02190 [Bacteroidetes bacterium HGW-Bacteroidetes-8]|jgi:hypothetical protein|nr:MAG: hypothetical protein CVU13_02190 [Bacteroidetes bacterium HGW-Bacteroidetes-8]
MKNINSKSDLDRTIYALTQLQSAQEVLLKAQFERSLESLKPVNIIKNTFNDMANSPDLLKSILSTSLGFVSGFVTKKIFVGLSNNPFRKFLGHIIQIGVTTVISTNPDAVKTLGNKFIGAIFQRKSKS